MAKIKDIMNDIQAGWERQDKKRRTQLVIGVVLLSLVLFSVIYFIQRTEYSVLFSELEDADAGVIVEDLEGKNIDYKLEDNGSTILIDKKKIDTYRIELAVDGLLPEATTGFEIFDGGNLMATDDDRAIMYQRAISGELERAITSLKNVKKGKVLLNIPESSIFENPEYQKEASASVVLEMNNGKTPDVSTIQGITSLVSGAVDNLPSERVEIVDANGNLLNSNHASGVDILNSDIVTEHQLIKKSIENDLEQKVLSLLAPIYGIDKVQISVNTDLNFDMIEKEVVEYGEEAIRSQTENVSGNAALAGEVQVGVLDRNTDTRFEFNDEEDNSSYHHTTNYELDTTTSNIVEAPGAVQRITASVIILDNPNNEGAIQIAIENALGIDNRIIGDEDNEGPRDDVFVEFMPMTTDAEEEFPVIDGGEFVNDLIEAAKDNWLILLGVLVLLIVIIVVFRIIRNRREEEIDVFEERLEPVVEPQPEPESELEVTQYTEEKRQKLELANEKEDLIRQQAKDSPQLAAELIKIWLKEEE